MPRNISSAREKSCSGTYQEQEKMMQRDISSAREKWSSGTYQAQEKIMQRIISSAREDHAAEHVKCKKGMVCYYACPPPPRNPPETNVEDMWGAADRQTNNATRHRSPDVAIERKMKIMQRNVSSARKDHAAEHIKRKRRSCSGACQVQEGHGLLLSLAPPHPETPPKPPETHVEDMWGAADRQTNNATRHRSPDVAIERKMKIMQRNISSARKDHAAKHIKCKRRSCSGACQVQEGHGLLLCLAPPPTPKPPRNPCWRHVGCRR